MWERCGNSVGMVCEGCLCVKGIGKVWEGCGKVACENDVGRM